MLVRNGSVAPGARPRHRHAALAPRGARRRRGRPRGRGRTLRGRPPGGDGLRPAGRSCGARRSRPTTPSGRRPGRRSRRRGALRRRRGTSTGRRPPTAGRRRPGASRPTPARTTLTRPLDRRRRHPPRGRRRRRATRTALRVLGPPSGLALAADVVYVGDGRGVTAYDRREPDAAVVHGRDRRRRGAGARGGRRRCARARWPGRPGRSSTALRRWVEPVAVAPPLRSAAAP